MDVAVHLDPSLPHTPELQLPSSVWNLDGFRAWAKSNTFPQRGHYAFLGHRIFVDLTMAAIEEHSLAKQEIARSLGNWVVKHDLGEVYPDGVLVTNEAAQIANEPDGSFASWEALESGRVRLATRTDEAGPAMELVGVPDWVMEIVSPSSVAKDTRWLRELYHQAGIPEYWLIDARGDTLSFQILRHAPGGYEPAAVDKGWQRSPAFGCRCKLTRERGRLGHWKYALALKR
jgi:Uma2 family endonuclease